MREKARQGIKWILIGRQSQFGVSIVFQILIMKILSMEVYGIYALAISSLGIVAVTVSFDTAHAIIQFQHLKNIEKNVLFVSLLQAAAFILLSSPGYFIVKKVYGDPVAGAYLLLIGAQALTFVKLVFQFEIERSLDFKKTEIILFIAKIIGVTVTLILAYLRCGVFSLIIGYYVTILLESGLLLSFSRWNYSVGWDRDVIKEIVQYAGKRFFARGCGVMIEYADKLILGLVVSVEMVGAYERALFLISAIVGLTTQINGRFVFSLINKIKQQHQKLVLFVNMGIFINLVFSSAMALLIFFSSRQLIIFILGSKWAVTASLVQYFSIYFLGLIPLSFIVSTFFAVKEPLQIAWSRLLMIGLFFAASLCFFLIKALNINTMALILGCSVVVATGFLVIILIKDRLLELKNVLRPVIFALLTGAITLVFRRLFHLPPVINGLFLVLSYAALLWRFGRREIIFIKEYLI